MSKGKVVVGMSGGCLLYTSVQHYPEWILRDVAYRTYPTMEKMHGR